MNEVKYQIIKTNKHHRNLRIVNFNNIISNKTFVLPGVMFYLSSQEDIEAAISYFAQDKPYDHIFGFFVPIHKSESDISRIRKSVPPNINIVCDIENESLWTKIKNESTLDDSIPKLLEDDLRRIITAKTTKAKKIHHQTFWNKLTNDKKLLVPLILDYGDYQSKTSCGIDYIISFGPMFVSKNDIDTIEFSYDLSKKLYKGVDSKFVASGKRLGLHLNLHSEFLTEANIVQLIKMIERVTPDFLVLKFQSGDIRRRGSLHKIYEFTMMRLGEIATVMEIPLFYLNAHSEGYRAHRNGISVFVESFKYHYNLNKPVKMSKIQLNRMKGINPLFESGRIYDIKKKIYVTRSEHEESFETHPLREGLTSEDLKSMTSRTFRDYAKWKLMESRNVEEDELHEIIRKDKHLT